MGTVKTNIKNSYTEKSPAETIGEIQQVLSRYGARKIQMEYNEDAEPVALDFSMMIEGNEVFFRLTVNPEGLLKAMRKDKGTRTSQCNIAQAKRTAWRNRLEWLRINLVEIETGQADAQELLLGFAVTDNGQALYQRLLSDTKLLKEGR